MATDRRTGDEMPNRAPANASRIVSYAGSTYGVGGIAEPSIFGRARTTNERARRPARREALIDSAIVVTALKEITQRAATVRERSQRVL